MLVANHGRELEGLMGTFNVSAEKMIGANWMETVGDR